MRVIFDTNILISFALGSRALLPLQTAWREHQFTLLLSQYLLTEVNTVLLRDKFRARVSEEDRQTFLSDLLGLTEPIMVKQPFPEFTDPKDRYLLAMLRDSDAELLVTGDALLLELKSFGEKPIIAPAQFIDYLQSDEKA